MIYMYTAQLVYTNSKINSAPFFIVNHFTFLILSLIVVIRQLTSASRIVFSKNHMHGTKTLSMSMHTNRADMLTRLHETREVNYKNQTEQPLHPSSRPPKTWLQFVYEILVLNSIICKPDLENLNKRNELATSCRHARKFLYIPLSGNSFLIQILGARL